MTKARDLADFVSAGNPLADGTIDVADINGLTATTEELNVLDGATLTTTELNILDGITATTQELNILDGITATTSELNVLDGITATTSELNVLDGITATTSELNYLHITTVGVSQASKVITTDSSNNTNVGGTVTAGFFSGDGSNLTNLPPTAPTTSDVLSAIAGLTPGDVGTYVFGSVYNSVAGTTLTTGEIIAGSNLRAKALVANGYPDSVYAIVTSGNVNPSTLSGSWKSLGYAEYGQTTWGYFGLFVRVA